MNPTQAKHLARNPREMMQYKATGRLPQMVRPSSPLITLLEAIGPRDRHRIGPIRLSPALGYHSHQTFATAEQLYRFVKPAPEIVYGEPFPAEQIRDKSFNRRLSIADLQSHKTAKLSDAIKV